MTKLRQERIDRDWTLEFVARRAGVINQALSAIETGKAKPSYAILLKLENLFGKSHRELFESDKESQSE